MVSGGTGPNATAHLSWAAASSGCEPHHDHDPATGTVANSALPVAGSFNPPGTLADDLNPGILRLLIEIKVLPLDTLYQY